ncbi:HAMP domain-containing sensor histidine kinase [Aestuariivirga sp.]|uniref:sensor histidine kinase n=1 Tax=Aestuariivirga sp. TaxID=2650926 RepID=UPI0025BB5B33|nr:HAMP domain-containing sensor histidine kinase [Aestuariivirga sp.]MCA3555621.1 HAMP domain-containing histidine kinase [Aestuariivirga sp.]
MTGGAARHEGPGLLRGLSGKVLAMTVVFVMLGEVLIFLPSIANFRIQWLKGRIAQAEIAALAAEAAPDRILSPDLRTEILKGAGVLVVSLTRGETRRLMLRSETDHMIDASYDLRGVSWPVAIADAFAVLLQPAGRVIGVIDKPPNMSGDVIEVALFEKPLREAMLRSGLNIFLLSVVLSAIVAGLVYLALNIVLIRPMKRLTRNMTVFAQNPEDRSRIIVPSARQDEIGIAERELHDMQSELTAMLQQKSRLAALGLAAAKVSHDLRNMLSSAHVISDRLSMAEDPTVKRFAPKLIVSLDRAISFLTATLKFGRADEPPPVRERLPLKDIAEEVIDTAVLQASSRVVLFNHVPPGLEIDADREHLNRVLTNLLRNAIQALEHQEEEADGRVILSAWREGAVVVIEVRDNGPGIPERVRPKLFEAFQSAARPGGVGLGLAIAAELIRSHGGEIRLRETGPEGTVFHVVVPDAVVELRPGRRGARNRA